MWSQGSKYEALKKHFNCKLCLLKLYFKLQYSYNTVSYQQLIEISYLLYPFQDEYEDLMKIVKIQYNRRAYIFR